MPDLQGSFSLDVERGLPYRIFPAPFSSRLTASKRLLLRPAEAVTAPTILVCMPGLRVIAISRDTLIHLEEVILFRVTIWLRLGLRPVELEGVIDHIPLASLFLSGNELKLTLGILNLFLFIS